MIVSKCQNKCGRMLNPLLLLLYSLFVDHHGEAAEGDVPGLAQLPGADHGALHLCESGRQALSSPARAQGGFPSCRRSYSKCYTLIS